jgi:hypothetical protein
LYVALLFLRTIETNVGEAEGEDFGEGVEEDQGLASQGKPFTLTLCCPCSWLRSFYPWSLDFLRLLGFA